MPTIDEVIGARLRARREFMGRSAVEFADYLGITPDEFEAIENGERRLGPELLAKACRALDVQPQHFFADGDVAPDDRESGNDRNDDGTIRH